MIKASTHNEPVKRAGQKLSPNHVNSGFTLLELMVVLAITGILVAIAAPGFQSAIRGSTIESSRDALAAAIKSARGEALFQKTNVTICASTDQATCAGAAQSWHNGWITFSDDDGDGVVDAADDTILAVNYGFDNIRIQTDGTGGTITFAANGIRTQTGTWTIEICDANTSTTLPGDGMQISTVGNVSYTNNVSC